jgi:hypothetical protein
VRSPRDLQPIYERPSEAAPTAQAAQIRSRDTGNGSQGALQLAGVTQIQHHRPGPG